MKTDRFEYHDFICAPCTRAHGSMSPMSKDARKRLHEQRKAQKAYAVALRQARQAKLAARDAQP